jgi:hypothetical protein
VRRNGMARYVEPTKYLLGVLVVSLAAYVCGV